MKTHASAAFSGNGIGPGVMGARYSTVANHRPEFLPRATALLSILKGKGVAEGIVAPYSMIGSATMVLELDLALSRS